MNTLSEFFTHPVIQAIGWALLHSIWQGLLIVLLLKLALTLIPTHKSTLRYGVSLAGLAAIPIAGFVTVGLLLPQISPAAPLMPPMLPHAATAPAEGPASLFLGVTTYIENQMPFILSAWIAGVMVCSLRLAAGWVYLSHLTSTSQPVSGYWQELTSDLARQLAVRRDIRLAESGHTDSPAVIGIFKPVILVPIGMFAGLSAQQVEAVLLHELTHIRRHDFMVNLAQSLMEVVYFFNPFVWIISSMVRDEREFCCDDVVVQRYSRRVYAEALAYLETSRALKTKLSLSLSGGKNNLLYRIKRFMETSKPHQLAPQWVIPVALGAVGLLCTSWLTIGGDPGMDKAVIHAAVPYGTVPGRMVSDTITPPQEKRATYIRKKIVTIDENGEPHEEVVEKFEGDEDLRRQMNYDFQHDFAWGPDSIRWQSFGFDSLIDPQAFSFKILPPDMDFQFVLPDSFPAPRYHWDVDVFRQEFETMFKEKFSDFYKDHAQDLEGMMDKIEEKFQHFQEDTTWQRELRRSMREVERNMKGLRESMERTHRQNGGAMLRHRDSLQKHQAMLFEVQEQMLANQQWQQKELAMATARMQQAQEEMQLQLQKRHNVMENLRKQLIKDGYLGEGEPVRSLHWSNEGMKINGRNVRPKDVKRYEKLNKNWMQNDK